jgi:exopolyphosphatase / guanosine-5'-triphosphate,3'-diphosphate pyrophosphatase
LSQSLRIATIDIGTNSVLLLIVEGNAQRGFNVLEERCTITRIGKGVDQTGLLADDRVEHTLEILREYVDAINGYGVNTISAIGTSALRDASNGAQFLKRAKSLLGIAVEIVSGAKEARLILAGVRSSFPSLDHRSLVFDIGGGSTEFIVPDESEDSPQVISLNIGTVRLTERHIETDPPERVELNRLEKAIDAALAKLPTSFSTGDKKLVGVAGTVTTLAAISLAMEDYDSERINGVELSLADIEEMSERLITLPLHERKIIPGLMPERADVIVSGAILTAAILRFFNVNHCQVCDRGVRWGAIQEAGTRAH